MNKGEFTVTHLKQYTWRSTWTSHMGCLKAAADYLGLQLSMPWIFGGTGHAFIINMHHEGCPSGPTAWRTEMLFELGNNLGYTVNGVWGGINEQGFAEKLERGRETIAYALDKGLPCYGWEIEIPEYYCISGYDDDGFYYTGPTAPEVKGPKAWDSLAKVDIGLLELYYVERGEPAHPAVIVREALQFAMEHATSPVKWTYPGYKAGLQGWDLWIKAVEKEHNPIGFGYNAAVWQECRCAAVEFLKEAAERLGDEKGLFAGAIEHYTAVRDNLAQLTRIYPFPPQEDTTQDKEQAIELLNTAREAEAKGLAALGLIVDALNNIDI